jgi:hypothetical protein
MPTEIEKSALSNWMNSGVFFNPDALQQRPWSGELALDG